MLGGKSKSVPRCVEFGPAEASQEQKKQLEKGFVLDGIAVGTFACTSGHASPKLATAIPPYNAQKDPWAKMYFERKEVKKTLKKTGQSDGGVSISGSQVDRFYKDGQMGKYINLRNETGAGHSTEMAGGHGTFMTNVSPMNGFNGPFGFRRNTPWLRDEPSSFKGPVDSRSVVP